MVQFLSIIFFLGFLQFLLGFSKVPVFLCQPVLMLDAEVRLGICLVDPADFSQRCVLVHNTTVVWVLSIYLRL